MMTRRQLARAGICAGLAAATVRPSRADTATDDGLRRILDAAVAAGSAPGFCAVVGSSQSAWAYSTGFSDLEARSPMSCDTIFRVASITKPVVAAAAMVLVDKGKVRLDDPIDHWIPELANRRVVRTLSSDLDDTVAAVRRITVRDLLSLQMGIGAIFEAPPNSPLLSSIEGLGIAPGPGSFPGTDTEFLRRLSSVPLACQPGERWLYHTGMEVAGVLISRISGQPLSEFVEERLLRPLHMNDTGFWVPEAKKTRLATCYGFAPDGRLAPYQWPGGPATEPPKMESGGGGLFSTADDFCRFGLMLLNDGEVACKRVLSPRSVAAMRSDQVAPRVKQASPFFPGFWKAYSWGLGMAVGVRADSTSGIGGFGWWGGTGTTFFANPIRSKVAVLLSQRMMARPDDSAVGDAFVTAAFAG